MPIAVTTRFVKATDAPSQIIDLLSSWPLQGVVLQGQVAGDHFGPLTQELLLRRQTIPVVALESPCAAPTRAELCGDRDESLEAQKAAEMTLERAAELSAPYVVLRLGEARLCAPDWEIARNRFLRDDLDEELIERLIERREKIVTPLFDNVRRALDRLLRSAESFGTKLLVRTRRRYTELPTVVELRTLLQDYVGAPLSPLLDLPAAHLLDVMGFSRIEAMVKALGAEPVAYVGDAAGPVGALPPGRGVIDLAALAPQLKATTRIFDPWPGLAHHEIAQALDRMTTDVA